MAKPLALIFGESPNDANALKHLIPALLPAGSSLECRAIREPGTMSKGAVAKKRKAVAQAIAIAAKYEAKVRNTAVVAHEDCDECEDAHIERAAQMKAELAAAGIEVAVAAAPAWEMETWWMLFPEALQQARKCWAIVDFSGRNVGDIADAKEVLRRALRPTGRQGKCRDYCEADSERIAEHIERLGLGRDEKRIKRSKSLQHFRDQLTKAFA